MKHTKCIIEMPWLKGCILAIISKTEKFLILPGNSGIGKSSQNRVTYNSGGGTSSLTA